MQNVNNIWRKKKGAFACIDHDRGLIMTVHNLAIKLQFKIKA